MADFKRALDWVLVNEGTAYVNDPDDPGGPTRYGITQRTLGMYRRHPVTAKDVRDIDMGTVSHIYSAYWDAILGDTMGLQGMATLVLDAAILIGTARCIRMLRSVMAERLSGPALQNTVTMIAAATDYRMDPNHRRSLELDFVLAYQAHLIDRALTRPGLAKFLPGWMRRVERGYRDMCMAYRPQYDVAARCVPSPT